MVPFSHVPPLNSKSWSNFMPKISLSRFDLSVLLASKIGLPFSVGSSNHVILPLYFPFSLKISTLASFSVVYHSPRMASASCAVAVEKLKNTNAIRKSCVYGDFIKDLFEVQCELYVQYGFFQDCLRF